MRWNQGINDETVSKALELLILGNREINNIIIVFNIFDSVPEYKSI